MSLKIRKPQVRWAGVALALLMLLAPVASQEQEVKDPSTPIKNVQFQAAEIRSVLTFLADYGQVNVIVAPNVEGAVTIRLTDVHWRTAMNIIGRTYDLAVVDDDGGYVRVLRSEDYRKEISEQNKHDAEQRKLVDLQTKIIKVSNSTADDMVETVKGLMTDRGEVSSDTRSNSLIIKEVPDHMVTVLDYIAELDKPARQIKISAQLLEINSQSLEELGINWSAEGTYVTETGRRYSQEANVLADRSTDSDVAGRYTVSALNNDWSASAVVEALVSSGKGKIIAHPEITTVENSEARIQMGQKIPVKQFDESGNVVIKFEEVGTILVVTPHISGDGQVLMHLRPERSTYQYDPNGVIINTNNAETHVIVNNGQTAVIGGLTTQDEVDSEIGVPLLKDIPILGRIFKFTQTRVDNRDLVIFVTPTIVDENLAMKP
ncbi:MAG: hypothetical protein KKA42_08690 [candidate division Zixibacteria bacterium]|nr:hypothetical protein [candidate division Zixibacteria bacterium]